MIDAVAMDPQQTLYFLITGETIVTRIGQRIRMKNGILEIYDSDKKSWQRAWYQWPPYIKDAIAVSIVEVDG